MLVGEGVMKLALRRMRDVVQKRALGQRDHDGSRDQVSAPHAVPVEKRQQRQRHDPEQGKRAAPPDSAAPRDSRTPSGMKISNSRVRFRAITDDGVSGPPLRSTTRSRMMRLPGVEPCQASSK